MGRKTARKNAFTLCFQMSFYDALELENVLAQFYTENSVSEDDEEYITNTVSGVIENIKEIDALIIEHSEKWNADRIGRVDMAIMRVCVFEILKMKDIPVSVSMNEAVELAKKYGSDESPTFVNGVLGGILRHVEQ